MLIKEQEFGALLGFAAPLPARALTETWALIVPSKVKIKVRMIICRFQNKL
jgi:hypothetical protein